MKTINLISGSVSATFDCVTGTQIRDLSFVLQKAGYKVVVTKQKRAENVDFCFILIQIYKEIYSAWLSSILTDDKQVPTFAFGRAATGAGEYLLSEFSRLNAVLIGFYEYNILNVILNYENGGKLNNLNGLLFKENGKLVKTAPYHETRKYDDFPFPDEAEKALICGINTTRACCGKCNFCEGKVFRDFAVKTDLRKSAARIFEELKFFHEKAGSVIFVFSDDNFFGNRDCYKRAEELADLIIENKLNIRFMIDCRSDDISLELFTKLKKAGLMTVFIGLESGSDAMLLRIGKGLSSETNRNAIEILRKLKINIVTGVILFDPWTTVKELKESIEFFEITKINVPDESIFNVEMYFPPHTEIRRRAEKDFNIHEESDFRDIFLKKTEYPFKDENVKAIYKSYKNNVASLVENGEKLKFSDILGIVKKAIKETENGNEC